MTNYLNNDIETLHKMLKEKKIKPIDLVEESYEKYKLNKDLNCFITFDIEGARKKAKELENVPCDNLLYGIPIAVKDNIVTKDLLTTAASKILYNFNPTYNAHVIDLINKNNMIVVGKLNMDEFAFGSSSGTSYYGPVRNPWNKALVPGGSSGGSAAATSIGITSLTLGSDTGGSIRQPSAFCGTVGLKPTYGLISRYGLIAFASSLDQIGPITKNVKDNANLLNILTKKDERDLTNIGSNEDYTRLIGKDIKGIKIAIPRFYINDSIDQEIIDNINKVVEMLKEKGAIVDIIDMKYIDYAVPLYQIIALGEASSNLARYDGIKYGYSTEKSENIDDFYKKTRSESFGDEVKRRIMIGSYLLSGKNAKEYFEKAQKVRRLIKNEFNKVFENYDLIIGPTTTTLPYKVGESLNDAIKSFMDDILTIPVNMAGLPGMSIPVGFSKTNLPIGMQIIANSFEEAKIYQLGSLIEKELNLNLIPGGDK